MAQRGAISRVTLRLALDPQHWRNEEKAAWTSLLINAVDAAAPHIFQIEGYDIGDTLVFIRMRSEIEPTKLRRMLDTNDALIRLRARLADLGARPDYEFED
jgi:hypothetical protein